MIYLLGFGKLNLLNAYSQLLKRINDNENPKASVIPSVLDLTQCPYMWPYCSQPLYYSSMPIMLNITILNPMGVSGEISEGPFWKPLNSMGEKLDVSFSHSDLIWPWTGYLSLHLQVQEEAKNLEGIAQGVISFVVTSLPQVVQI